MSGETPLRLRQAFVNRGIRHSQAALLNKYSLDVFCEAYE